jgi:hypothetical protein
MEFSIMESIGWNVWHRPTITGIAFITGMLKNLPESCQEGMGFVIMSVLMAEGKCLSDGHNAIRNREKRESSLDGDDRSEEPWMAVGNQATATIATTPLPFLPAQTPCPSTQNHGSEHRERSCPGLLAARCLDPVALCLACFDIMLEECDDESLACVAAVFAQGTNENDHVRTAAEMRMAVVACVQGKLLALPGAAASSMIPSGGHEQLYKDLYYRSLRTAVKRTASSGL